MNEKEFYYTIEKTSVAAFSERGSRFIAHSFPLREKKELKIHLGAVKKEHPKATHYCFAYRLGLEGLQFRSSDDGEPAGTAGKPILGQLDSRELTNTLIIVARYFGGTLLGVSGLINAYKTAASLVLQVTPIVQKQLEVNYHVQFDYTLMNDIMMLVKQYNCTMLARQNQLFCSVDIGIPLNRADSLLNRLRESRNVEVQKIN
ncbi:MAG: YigZ family protein [Bacteroidota bacterium]